MTEITARKEEFERDIYQNKYGMLPGTNNIAHLRTFSTPGSVAQSVENLIADPGVVSLIPAQPNTHTFKEIDCEIFSAVILLPLIQELLSVTSESMCTEYWLTT